MTYTYEPICLDDDQQTILDNLARGESPGKGVRFAEWKLTEALRELRELGLVSEASDQEAWHLTKAGIIVHGLLEWT